MSQDIFILLSVIKYSDKKLSYSDTRSIYNENDRILQTKETIESIRKYASPHSKIILFEIGRLDYSEIFAPLLDTYVFLGNKFLVRHAADARFKGLGEAIALLYSLTNIKAATKASLVFKLSGRYTLDKNFDRRLFSEEKINFKFRDRSVSTRLYAFPRKRLISVFIMNLFIIPLLISGMSIERAYYFFIKIIGIKINALKTLGVSGKIAVNGEVIRE